MRLENPGALAKLLLRHTPDWTDVRLDEVLAGGRTVRVPLARVMAYVNYWTVFADEAGQVQFRPEVYGWDAKLLERLGD